MKRMIKDTVTEVDTDKIYPNKKQPRKHFDKERINELAESIKKYGLLQPILLKEDSEGNYMIIAGERRYTACRLIGMRKILAVIKNITYEEADKIAIIENLQREDLSPVEEAEAYRSLIERYGLTQVKLSETVGKSRPYITNSMRLLNLSEEVLKMLDRGEITAAHGKILLRVEEPEIQLRMAGKIVRDGLSVRDLEAIVNNIIGKEKKKKEKAVYEKDLFILEAEDTLRNILGTKVNITKGKKSGKIEIEYYSEEDLESIISMLMD